MNLVGLTSIQELINPLFVILGVALFLAFIRLVRGPTLPDRVVALDLMTILAVAIITLYALATNERILLDTAIVLALISFLGTVAFARYVERRSRND